MNDERLTDELACRVLGWRVAPGRFIKTGRSWAPRYRFAPLTRLDDAFQLLDRAATDYKLTMVKGGRFAAEVQVGACTGNASGEPKARTITIALARALGLEIPDEADAAVSMPARRPSTRSRSKIDGI